MCGESGESPSAPASSAPHGPVSPGTSETFLFPGVSLGYLATWPWSRFLLGASVGTRFRVFLDLPPALLSFWSPCPCTGQAEKLPFCRPALSANDAGAMLAERRAPMSSMLHSWRSVLLVPVNAAATFANCSPTNP